MESQSMGNSCPVMYRVKQRFDTAAITDVPTAIRKEFLRLDLKRRVKPGQRVGVTVGSRGIDGLTDIVATVVDCLRDLELKPFIFPAMGSHGRATSDGQAEMLRGLGISEATVKAPIISSMDAALLDNLDSGARVHFSKDAMAADHVVVVNRVKPHTAFHSDVESGLCKMLAVGCGKHEGAVNMHKFGLAESIVPAAEMILRQAPVLCGLALLENSLDKIQTVCLAPPEEFVATDRKLLIHARRLLPRIPFEDLDILIVDEMGKDISGAGMDTNVIGFWRRDGGECTPDYRTLIVLDITKASHGNALGIGMADLTTRRVVDKIDFKATYTNALTTGLWTSVRTPITLENDKVVVEAALSKISSPDRVRMARIRNTLMLEDFWVTEALLTELDAHKGIIIDETPVQLEFDKKGRIMPGPGSADNNLGARPEIKFGQDREENYDEPFRSNSY
ncbi:MAG: DUF362 domain-containing protein [Syntrophaceae bacterium]|nr:DUF362 domain-containing protein [Syntrophaceae bacterium]